MRGGNGRRLTKGEHVCIRWNACRKKKAVHKSSGSDDKKLQSALKRIGVSTIPGIEEVNIFKEEEVISFANPKGEQEDARQRCGGAIDRNDRRNNVADPRKGTEARSNARNGNETKTRAIIRSSQRQPYLEAWKLTERVLATRDPTVQASLAANTFVVSGPSQTKSELPSPYRGRKDDDRETEG